MTSEINGYTHILCGIFFSRIMRKLQNVHDNYFILEIHFSCFLYIYIKYCDTNTHLCTNIQLNISEYVFIDGPTLNTMTILGNINSFVFYRKQILYINSERYMRKLG